MQSGDTQWVGFVPLGGVPFAWRWVCHTMASRSMLIRSSNLQPRLSFPFDKKKMFCSYFLSAEVEWKLPATFRKLKLSDLSKEQADLTLPRVSLNVNLPLLRARLLIPQPSTESRVYVWSNVSKVWKDTDNGPLYPIQCMHDNKLTHENKGKERKTSFGTSYGIFGTFQGHFSTGVSKWKHPNSNWLYSELTGCCKESTSPKLFKKNCEALAQPEGSLLGWGGSSFAGNSISQTCPCIFELAIFVGESTRVKRLEITRNEL